MTEMHFYSIMRAVNPSAIRLGWVSPSTGITYCGICLRGVVIPQIGAECKICGAHVAQLLDIRARGDDLRRTWKEAISVPIEFPVTGARATAEQIF
ncbi:MAG: hypothetical protein ABSE96_11535 [Terracidiphilus sp.]|jgi:hypothetical protein